MSFSYVAKMDRKNLAGNLSVTGVCSLFKIRYPEGNLEIRELSYLQPISGYLGKPLGSQIQLQQFSAEVSVESSFLGQNQVVFLRG